MNPHRYRLSLLLGILLLMAWGRGQAQGWGRGTITVRAGGWQGRLTQNLWVRACPYYIRLHGMDLNYHTYDSFQGEFITATATFRNVPVPPGGVARYRVEVVWLCRFTRRRVDPDHDHDDHSDAVRRNVRTWDQADAAEITLHAGESGHLYPTIQGIDIPGDVYP